MQQSDETYGQSLSPEFLAKYEVTGVLGEGGMGQVLRARQMGLGREVAVKFLTNRSYATPERRQRFKDEAQRCAQMRHPNLVEIYDYGEEGERPYMAMELVDGESLADRIKRDGKLPIKLALRIGVDICAGLTYAHEQGLVHRDIKSDNILLDKTGKKVKVADFGIATESEGQGEKENVIIGTPSYMSPEQASGRKADGRSDIYSTGVILYEMLTGKVPFTGETSMAIIIKHLNEQAAGMRDLNPDVPPQLEEIVLRALEKDVNHRYQRAQDLASQLKKAGSLLDSWQALAKEGPSSAGARSSASMVVPISSIGVAGEEERRRQRMVYSMVAAGVGVVMLIAAYFLFLAPPTITASDGEAKTGFTQAEVRYRSSHPSPTVVEYREGVTGEVKRFEASDETTDHSALLEELKEDTSYSWRPLFPHDQVGDWAEFQTRTLRFTKVETSPRVNGARLAWRTSLPVEMEVEYLQEGRVKEISRIEGIRTDHSFSASFADPSIPYQIRLKAILDGRFTKSHLLEEVPTIDLAKIDRLTEAISTALTSEAPDMYPADVLDAVPRNRIPESIQEFTRIRDLFFTDPLVRPEVRLKLVMHLLMLRELDLFVAWAGDALDAGGLKTRAEEGFGDGFLPSTDQPFRGGRTSTILATPKRMVFDPDPPKPPITGERPDDATDNAKFEVEAAVVEGAEQAYLTLEVEDVAHNCYFLVELGHSARVPVAVLPFLPTPAMVRQGRPYSATLYARIDPRFINARKPLYGWVRLRHMRSTVFSTEQAQAEVRGTFKALSLTAK